jgi:hypothetical protein
MMWRLSVGNFMHFARYETPMIAGFRKYALAISKSRHDTFVRQRAVEARSAAYW